jgi:hypothetical protein
MATAFAKTLMELDWGPKSVVGDVQEAPVRNATCSWLKGKPQIKKKRQFVNEEEAELMEFFLK